MQHVTRATPQVISVRNAFVNPGSATTTSIVAGVANKIYIVVAVYAVTTIANVLTFKTNTTAISPDLPLGANGGIVLPYNEHGYFRTVAGDPLQVTTTTAGPAGIAVLYVELNAPS